MPMDAHWNVIAGLTCSSVHSESSPVFVVGHYQHHERECGSNEWLVLGWLAQSGAVLRPGESNTVQNRWKTEQRWK